MPRSVNETRDEDVVVEEDNSDGYDSGELG